MRKLQLLWCALLLAVAASGCTSYSAGIAPSTLPLDQDGYLVFDDAEGTSWGFTLIFLPLAVASPQEAIQDALESSRAEGLIEVTVENKSYFFMLQKIVVRGKAIKRKVLDD